MESYDAIVVGAGPAGNQTALSLAESGRRVAVLDWRRDPSAIHSASSGQDSGQAVGDKLCTGIIGIDCARRFPPDDSVVRHRANAATVVSPAGSRYRIARVEPQATVIDRAAYVAGIARRAMDAGAEYRLGERVTGVEVRPGGVEVSTGSEAGRGRGRLCGQMLVIASGFRSPLLDMAGLPRGGPRDLMIGSQVEVEADGVEDAEVYLGRSIAPGSFGWLVPTGKSTALAGLMSQKRLNGHMDDFLRCLSREGRLRRVSGRVRSWGIPLRPPPRTFADRVLVVGDAAGQVKPTTGGGIYYARLSGELAGETACGAFAASDFSARRLAGYERAWKALLGRELRVGYFARLLYSTLDDSQIERLLSRVVGDGMCDELVGSRDFSFDWHSETILRAAGNREFRSLLLSLGPVAAPSLARLAGVLLGRWQAPGYARRAGSSPRRP